MTFLLSSLYPTTTKKYYGKTIEQKISINFYVEYMRLPSSHHLIIQLLLQFTWKVYILIINFTNPFTALISQQKIIKENNIGSRRAKRKYVETLNNYHPFLSSFKCSYVPLDETQRLNESQFEFNFKSNYNQLSSKLFPS